MPKTSFPVSKPKAEAFYITINTQVDPTEVATKISESLGYGPGLGYDEDDSQDSWADQAWDEFSDGPWNAEGAVESADATINYEPNDYSPDDHDLRERALDFALEYYAANPIGSADDITENAKVFEAYLRG